MTERLGWVEAHQHDDYVVAAVHGEVDMSNAADIEAALDAATAGRLGRYYVDLTQTTYLDSSGIRVLFVLATRLQSRRQELRIIVPEGAPTRRVLEMTDLQRVAPIVSAEPGAGE